jgi:hypothetical protein
MSVFPSGMKRYSVPNPRGKGHTQRCHCGHDRWRASRGHRLDVEASTCALLGMDDEAVIGRASLPLPRHLSPCQPSQLIVDDRPSGRSRRAFFVDGRTLAPTTSSEGCSDCCELRECRSAVQLTRDCRSGTALEPLPSQRSQIMA